MASQPDKQPTNSWADNQQWVMKKDSDTAIEPHPIHGGGSAHGGNSDATNGPASGTTSDDADRSPVSGWHYLSRRPLKRSLVVVTVSLVAVGLAVFSLTVAVVMESFMKNRVDEQLYESIAPQGWVMNYLRGSSGTGNEREDGIGSLLDSLLAPHSSNSREDTDDAQDSGDHDNYDDDHSGSADATEGGQKQGNGTPGGLSRAPTNFYVVEIHANGLIENFVMDPRLASAPELSGVGPNSPPVDVPARVGSASSASWRAISTPRNSEDGSYRVVALPMEQENNTISQLLWMQLFIGGIVIALVLVATLQLVKRALRPLYQVEEIASEISKGNLRQRVPNWPAETEVGRLSIALNKMLAQIQFAFLRLSETAKVAEQNEVAMRRFIGDASHELRTPLTSVRGYAELYRAGATDDASMVIDRIHDESQRMSLLVEDLLALVRMDEGRPLAQENVDMLELVLAAADNARAAFPDRSIAVQNRAGGVPVVKGDPNRLHQVVGNLVTNALRHAGDAAAVTLTLASEGDKVLVTVADDGRGIDAKDLPHIFERFYRPDVSRSRASGGSGLGLSIVKGLVAAHGGSIEVHSVVGEGTSFRISLPAHAVEHEDGEADAADTLGSADAESHPSEDAQAAASWGTPQPEDSAEEKNSKNSRNGKNSKKSSTKTKSSGLLNRGKRKQSGEKNGG